MVNGTGESRLVYSVEEAGKLLGLGRSGAYEAVRRGDIPTIRIGRRWLVRKAALDSMLSTFGQNSPESGDTS